MHKLALLVVAALVAPACAPADDHAAVESETSDLVASSVVGPFCSEAWSRALLDAGVAYVALCPTESGQSDVLRVDLAAGTTQKLGSYSTASITFRDVGKDYAVWSADPPRTVPGLDVLPPTTVGLWEAANGTTSFVAEDVLQIPSGSVSVFERFGHFLYAGNGRVLAAWSADRAKVSTIEARATPPVISWQADAPYMMDHLRFWDGSPMSSADHTRFLFTRTLVDLGGVSPRVVALPPGLSRPAIYTWDGDHPRAPWDGKRAFFARDGAHALVDLDTLVQFPLGKNVARETTFAHDGTIAFYTEGASRETLRVEILRPGETSPAAWRELPVDLRELTYVAPRGAWVLASSSKPDGGTWIIDFTDTTAAPVRIMDSGKVRITVDAGVTTVAMTLREPHRTGVVRIADDLTASPMVQLDDYVQFLSSDRVLAGRKVGTFDGTSVTFDADGALPSDDAIAPVTVVAGKRRLVTRRPTRPGAHYATYPF